MKFFLPFRGPTSSRWLPSAIYDVDFNHDGVSIERGDPAQCIRRSYRIRQPAPALLIFIAAALSALFHPLTNKFCSLLALGDEANCIRPPRSPSKHQMHTSSQATSDFLPVSYLSLSLVVLGVVIFQCILVLIHVFRIKRMTGNTRSTGHDGGTGHDNGTGTGYSQVDHSWIATDHIFRCIYVVSLLLAIGLVVFGRLSFVSLRKLDQKRFQDVLLALLVSISRVYIVYESQFLRLVMDSYRYTVWIGWGYCIVLLIVLSSLIAFSINQNITIKISLICSFVEYLVVAIGHITIYSQFSFQRQLQWQLRRQLRQRLRVIFYTNTIACFLAGIIALILFVLSFVVNVHIVLFQWAHAVVTSLFMPRYLVFIFTREGTTPVPTCATYDSRATSRSELTDDSRG